jgi:hypothetical protein
MQCNAMVGADLNVIRFGIQIELVVVNRIEWTPVDTFNKHEKRRVRRDDDSNGIGRPAR